MIGPFENTCQIVDMLLRLFKHWELPPNQQLAVMGMTDVPYAHISKHLNSSLSKDRDKLERANILLGVHKSLRVLFPRNRDLVYRWISQPNGTFGGLSPLEVIEFHGMLGMYMLRDYLNRHGATEGLTIEALVEGSPDVKLNVSEQEWLDEAPAGQELQDGYINCKNEEIYAMLDVWTAVLQVFEDEHKAKLWIGTIVPALRSAPIALLCTEYGREKILDALKRVERANFG